MTYKNDLQKWKTGKNSSFERPAKCSHLRAKGFSCSLDVLYGGLGKSKLQLLIKQKLIFSAFFQFLLMKILDLDQHPHPHWLKILDPDRHWFQCGSETLQLKSITISHNIVEYLSGCMAPVIICMMLNPEQIFKFWKFALEKSHYLKKTAKMKFFFTILLFYVFYVENCTWIQRLSLVFCPLGNFRFLHVGSVH